MNIEQLTKSQIVLLTLLVSFVTSIATGIVTVSLMDQAPPAIAQTVNRIIERTVEKVVPQGQSAASVITQEKTVVIRESALISQAISHIEPSVVRLYTSVVEDPEFLGFGIVTDGKGTIVSGAVLGEMESAVAELDDKSRVRAYVDSTDAKSGLVSFATATTTVDGKSITWHPASFAGKAPMLGETVIALTGKSVSRIAAGLVTTLLPPTDEVLLQTIDTDIDPNLILPGSPIVDADGSLVGISTSISRAVSTSGFIPATILLKPEEKEAP